MLESKSLTKKIFFLVANTRYELASDTLKQFKPSIPLSLESLIYGLIGGVFASILFYTLIRLPINIATRKFFKSSAQRHSA